MIVIGGLLNWYHQTSTVEYRAMFDGENKSIISTRTMQRELIVLGLNSSVALRKPLIREACNKNNNKKKGFSLQGCMKIKLWGKSYVV